MLSETKFSLPGALGCVKKMTGRGEAYPSRVSATSGTGAVRATMSNTERKELEAFQCPEKEIRQERKGPKSEHGLLMTRCSRARWPQVEPWLSHS